jgi:hypothetical protein
VSFLQSTIKEGEASKSLKLSGRFLTRLGTFTLWLLLKELVFLVLGLFSFDWGLTTNLISYFWRGKALFNSRVASKEVSVILVAILWWLWLWLRIACWFFYSSTSIITTYLTSLLLTEPLELLYLLWVEVGLKLLVG